MKKFFSLILCLSLLSACNQKVETKETVCTYTQDGLTITNILVSQEDVVLTQTLKNELDYEKFGYTSETIQMVVDMYKTAYEQAGIEYNVTYEGNILIEESTVDFQTADIVQLVTLGLIQVDGNTQYISLEKTVKSIQEEGFTCK